MSQDENKELTTFHYNGFDLSFDIENLEDTERYESAIEKMKTSEKLIKKDGKKSEYIKGYCMMIRTMFDDIFGNGASNKICGENLNSRTDTDAYNAFLMFVANQTDAGLAQKNAIATQFLNRAQRRAAAKNAK